MTNTGKPYKSPKGHPVVICDFDDTTAMENVAEMLLEEFGDCKWKEFRNIHQSNEISLMEYQELAFGTVSADRNTLKSFVRQTATLRDGFKPLFEFCSSENIPLVIVSLGLDFYIEALLEKEGLETIPYFAADTSFTEKGITYDYRYKWEGCWQPGNCKCLVLDLYRGLGYSPVIFAGDGTSDICPAKKSDVVFARRFLETYLSRNGLSFYKLSDFFHVIEILKVISTETKRGVNNCD
jgi:2,3-diketo-5-methylthio-1-phosphopentane phosphatase